MLLVIGMDCCCCGAGGGASSAAGVTVARGTQCGSERKPLAEERPAG